MHVTLKRDQDFMDMHTVTSKLLFDQHSVSLVALIYLMTAVEVEVEVEHGRPMDLPQKMQVDRSPPRINLKTRASLSSLDKIGAEPSPLLATLSSLFPFMTAVFMKF